MAIVRFGGGIMDMRGSHGGITASTNKGGAHIKRRTGATHPKTQRTGIPKARLSQCLQLWSNTLSDAQRLSWNVYASSNPRVNTLGDVHSLSGQQMFCSLNLTMLAIAQTPYHDPPVSTGIGTISAVLPLLDTGSASVQVQVNRATSGPNDAWVCFMSPPLSAGRLANYSNWKQVATSGTFGSLVNIKPAYLSIFGGVPTAAGQKSFFKVALANTVSGLITPYFITSYVWT